MAINFPSNPSNGDTHAGFTYNSTVGAWESTASVTQATLDGYLQVANSSSFATTSSLDAYLQVANSSSGTTVYSAISDLPLSGNESGAQAYVSGTNRLYLWTGSGWYNIALINTNPSLSGASATYNLNTDGSNTVVTLASTDPEGLPISFSVSHSGIGVGANAIATVTQSNNIFTFTPTTNTSLAGTFTTTFTASDGVNLAVANSSFTLAFAVNNSNYTTALITSVGTNLADNNDFVDSSTNSHTITAAGNVTQNTFSPYRHGGYSTLVGVADGTDFLSAAQDTSLNGLFSGDFTIEFWFNKLTDRTQNYILSKGGGTTREWGIAVQSNSVIVYWSTQGTSAGDTSKTFSATIGLNEWHHLAVTFDQSTSTITAYLDGTSLGTNTFTSIYGGNGTLYVGRFMDYTAISHSCHAYITDLRIVKGSIVYSSAFTPPTERLTAITNTSLLACHLPYIADGSTNGHTITVGGNTKTEPFAPYDYGTYASDDHGGSMYFDGTGDYLTTSASNDFYLDGQFTWECWVHCGSSYFRQRQRLLTPAVSSATGSAYISIGNDLGINGGAQSGVFCCTYSVSVNPFLYANVNGTNTGTAVTVPLNQWCHLAITRDSNNDVKMWQDGVLVASGSYSGAFDFNRSVGARIGGSGWSTEDFGGHMTDVRIVKGTAVYTSAFTPPTAPLTDITNTSLLLNGTDAGIIDKSQSIKTLTLNGDVKSSTTQTKYLSSSMYFDGTGDYIQTDSSTVYSLGTSDFTIEMWVNGASSQPSDPLLTADWTGTWAANQYSLHYRHSAVTAGKISFWMYNYNSTSVMLVSTTTTSADTWHHVAVTREGSTFRLFVDGSLEASQTSSASMDSNRSKFNIIGSVVSGAANSTMFNGYLSDLRITKGLARYTSNFTPPTAALQG